MLYIFVPADEEGRESSIGYNRRSGAMGTPRIGLRSFGLRCLRLNSSLILLTLFLLRSADTRIGGWRAWLHFRPLQHFLLRPQHPIDQPLSLRIMPLIRANALRSFQSTLRSSATRAAPRARTQLVTRRFASSGGHGHAEPSSDLPW